MAAHSLEAWSTAQTPMGKRPSSDRLAMERARARTELALFGCADPARTGRYQILEPIAGGGMGFVYAAHDPELDRRVALKVLHPERSHDEYAHERLIKEARALARLDHPNVVTVHDVLGHDGEIVIVMELVAGETLESWAAAGRRSWRDVIAAYLQAGAGLAAAHELDIVHRDFKPSNAILGADGRVRVLDFGLARFTGEDPGGLRHGSRASASAMMPTASGVILGTLGYAAPEQLAGGPVTAASDQFSFCVALHQAIEGVLPFGGATVGELVSRIHGDAPALACDGRYVPAWLRAVLRRGLAADPARRHASMAALLWELGRPRGWKRWRWFAVPALLVAASVVVTAELRGAAGGVPACDGGELDVAAVWGPPHRAALAARLAQHGSPYVPEVTATVLAALDRQGREWAAVHRAACIEHRRGAASDALFDRTTLCLHQHLADLAAAITVLDGLDGDNLSHAVDTVAGIPPVQRCADAARLLTEPDPPATPALLARVTEVRSRLGKGAALSRAGRVETAVTELQTASVEAEGTQYPPVVAEAELAYGKVLATSSGAHRATPVLRDAMRAALASHQLGLAVEAAARWIYTEGVETPDLDRLARDLDFVEPMSRSVPGDHFARPLLLNNVGVAYMAAQRRDDALRYFRLAREAMAGDESPDLELTIVDQNIAMLAPDAELRARLSRERWLRLRAALGEHHLDTLQAQMAYAAFGADTATAYQLVEQACATYRRMHPAFVGLYVDCESVRGFLASELDRRDTAQEAYAAAIAAAAGSQDPALRVPVRLAAGELALLRGDLARARAELVAVVELRSGSEHWWVRKDALQAELGLGLAAAAVGDHAAAVGHLEAAARGFAELAGMNQGILYRLRLARARRALASVRLDCPERGLVPRH